MTNRNQRPDPSGFQIENEMDLLFGRAHPNPTRDGCPSSELLVLMSRRELPIQDPTYDHLGKCSPCYQELRSLQQAEARKDLSVKRRRMAYITAIVVLLAMVGAWFVLR